VRSVPLPLPHGPLPSLMLLLRRCRLSLSHAASPPLSPCRSPLAFPSWLPDPPPPPPPRSVVIVTASASSTGGTHASRHALSRAGSEGLCDNSPRTSHPTVGFFNDVASVTASMEENLCDASSTATRNRFRRALRQHPRASHPAARRGGAPRHQLL
jgi:hypothetical protein